MSLSVITVAEVVTWDKGISVRVEVTNTGGRVASGGSAAGNSKNENKKNNKKRKQTFIEISFSRERGVVSARRTGLLARALTYLPRLPILRSSSGQWQFVRLS